MASTKKETFDIWTSNVCTLKNGKVLSQNNGNKFAYITQEGVAIVSKEGKLITAWSSADFDSSMLEIIRKLFGEQVKRWKG